MRVTQGMLNNQILTDIQGNYGRLSELQNEAATGKRINRPSDDPVGVGYVMQYKDQLAYYQQYQGNVQTAQGWLNFTDSSMSQAETVLQRAKDLATQGASDTTSPDDRKAIAAEVGQLYQQMVSIGNSQYNGKYIFGGQMTTKAPYSDANAPTQTPDQGQVLFDIGDGVTLQVNVSGSDYFGSADASDNAFKVLQNLQAALNSNDTNGIEQAMGQLDSRHDEMLTAHSKVGAATDRTKLMDSRLSDLVQNVQTLLSNVQDADMAKVIMDLQSAQNVQTASLQVGAKVLQPTLVDFLK